MAIAVTIHRLTLAFWERPMRGVIDDMKMKLPPPAMWSPYERNGLLATTLV